VNDPRSLSDQDLDIAAMPGGARQYWFWPHRREPCGSRLRTIKRFLGRRLWPASAPPLVFASRQ